MKTRPQVIPLAHLIFGTKANPGLILLPIMFYHPFQLFVCGLLANRFFQPELRDLSKRGVSDRPTVIVPLTH